MIKKGDLVYYNMEPERKRYCIVKEVNGGCVWGYWAYTTEEAKRLDRKENGTGLSAKSERVKTVKSRFKELVEGTI